MTEPNAETRSGNAGSESREDRGRRGFFKTCLGGMGVLAGGFVAAPVVTFLQPPQKLAVEEKPEVALSEIESGQAIYREVRGTPIVVVKGEEKPIVLSAACTHLGCIVKWDDGTKTFRCPCHGAVFDLSGTPLKGPVNQPLPAITYEIKDGKIIIG